MAPPPLPHITHTCVCVHACLCACTCACVQVVPSAGVAVSNVDMTDLAAVKAAIIPGRTKMVLVESPTNPRMQVRGGEEAWVLGGGRGGEGILDGGSWRGGVEGQKGAGCAAGGQCGGGRGVGGGHQGLGRMRGCQEGGSRGKNRRQRDRGTTNTHVNTWRACPTSLPTLAPALGVATTTSRPLALHP